MQDHHHEFAGRGRIRRLPLQAVWRIGLCILLAGAAIFMVHAIAGLTAATEPSLNIFQKHLREAQTNAPEALHPKLRFAVATMVSAEETFSTYRRFVHRISRDVAREEAFIMRPSYENVRLALSGGEVDVALVCTGTYLAGLENKKLKILVQPEFEPGKDFRSLLLVASDSPFQTWNDLKNKTMAFTDHESFTGWLLPSAALAERGANPEDYFKKVIYTGSHDRSVMAITTHTVDAAAVMSLVWFSILEKQPALRDRVRIIWQSQSFGPPMIVVPGNLDRKLEEALRNALIALNNDDEGRRILAEIGIKRFVPARPETYASAMEVYKKYQIWLGKR